MFEKDELADALNAMDLDGAFTSWNLMMQLWHHLLGMLMLSEVVAAVVPEVAD